MSNRNVTCDTFEKGRWLQRRHVGEKYTWTVSGVLWNNIKERTTVNGSTQSFEPTYIGSENHFADFSEFVNWNRSQIGYAMGYDLDADMLRKDKKVYSPSTCLLIPPQLNRFIQGRSKNSYLPVGVSEYKNMFCAKCEMLNLDTGKSEIILNSLFSSVEKAAEAYDAAKNLCASVWVERLERGDFVVDARVIQFMKNFKYKTNLQGFKNND